MVIKYLLWYCLLLVLCLKQSLCVIRQCNNICRRWEGDKDAKNTICRRRYLRCVEEELYPSLGRWNQINAVPHFFKTIFHKSDVPCLDVTTRIEMDDTMCREYCHDIKNETQIELPLEACREDTYCCKLPDSKSTPFRKAVLRDLKVPKEPNDWTNVYKEMGWV